MYDFPAFFMDKAEASGHLHFVYDLNAGRVVCANAAYEPLLGGTCARVNEELPALLQRLRPDDRAYLAHYWARWARNQATDDVEVRLQTPNAPDQ
jgi:two-component system sensor histidine kinase VicK